MRSSLKRVYFCLLLPAVLGLALVSAGRYFNLFASNRFPAPALTAALIFTLSVVFAVALPIFYRSLFAHRMRHQTSTSEVDWFRFERNLILMALAAPYLTVFAHLFKLPPFHLNATILIALYAVYYYYPSRKRITHERRIFRVR